MTDDGGTIAQGGDTHGEATGSRPVARDHTRSDDGWRRRLAGDLRTATRITRTELRASIRRITGDRRQAAAVLFGFGQFVLWPLVFYGQVLAVGAETASGDPPVGVVSGVATGTLALGAFVGVTSALNRDQVGNVGTLLRVSATPRAVAVGRLASELLQAAALFAAPALGVTVMLGIGAGGPLAPTTLVAAALLPLAASLLVSRAVGSVVRYLGLLSGLSVWTKLLGGVVLFGTMLAGTQYAVSTVFEDGPFQIPAVLPGQPMGAYAATALAPVGGSVTPLGVVLLAGFLVAIPVGTLAAARVETWILLRDEGTGPGETVTTGSGAIPRLFGRSLSTRIAWRHLRRSKRDPRSLAHLFSFVAGPLAGVGYLLANPEQTLVIAGPAAVVLGSLVAGAAYCLNPLGDDREQLPWLFTTLSSTGVLLRGRMLAGVTVGLAIGLPGVALSAIAVSPRFAVGLAVLLPVLSLSGAGIALGLGAIAPKFERNEYLNVERAHPSQPALLGFFFVGTLVVSLGPTILWLWDTGAVPFVGAGVAIGVYLLVLSLGGVVGYLYARHRFDRLTLDQV